MNWFHNPPPPLGFFRVNINHWLQKLKSNLITFWLPWKMLLLVQWLTVFERKRDDIWHEFTFEPTKHLSSKDIVFFPKKGSKIEKKKNTRGKIICNFQILEHSKLVNITIIMSHKLWLIVCAFFEPIYWDDPNLWLLWGLRQYLLPVEFFWFQ